MRGVLLLKKRKLFNLEQVFLLLSHIYTVPRGNELLAFERRVAELLIGAAGVFSQAAALALRRDSLL